MNTIEWPILDIQKHPVVPDLYTIAIQRRAIAPLPGKAYQVKGIPQVIVEVTGEELVNPGQRGLMRLAMYLTGLSAAEATQLKGHAIVPKAEGFEFENLIR